MSLLDTLKSLLGLETSRQESRRGGDVGVTVEHEPSEAPDAESERAVKGTDEPQTAEGSSDGTDDASAESSDETTDDETTDDETTEQSTTAEQPSPDAADEPTEEISGIGPAYAEQLAGAGVETVGDLAAADPEALAEETDVSEKRLRDWVDRAKEK